MTSGSCRTTACSTRSATTPPAKARPWWSISRACASASPSARTSGSSACPAPRRPPGQTCCWCRTPRPGAAKSRPNAPPRLTAGETLACPTCSSTRWAGRTSWSSTAPPMRRIPRTAHAAASSASSRRGMRWSSLIRPRSSSSGSGKAARRTWMAGRRNTARRCRASATMCARTSFRVWCSACRAASTRRSPRRLPPTRWGRTRSGA